MKQICKDFYKYSKIKDVFQKLKYFMDKSPFHRNLIAESLITPVSVLIRMSKDPNFSVRLLVAQNPNTPIYILKELSKDKHYYVRAGIARNKNLPFKILKKLQADSELLVREYADTAILHYSKKC